MLTLTACGGSRAVAPVGSYGGNNSSTAGHYGATTSSASVYKVQKGDTLYSISFRYGMDYKELAKINGIRPPYNIYVDQKIHFKKARVAVAGHNKPVIKQRNGTNNTPTKWQAAPQTKQPTKTTTTAKTTTTVTTPSSTANQNLSWRWPTTGTVISTYSETSAGRKGIDIAGRSGQPVIASAAGKVVYSGNGLARYGNLLIIKHNEVYLSAYAHNETLLVKEGQQVKAGQSIATLGRSGAQREQLHFEIRRNGKPVDPLRFLPKQ